MNPISARQQCIGQPARAARNIHQRLITGHARKALANDVLLPTVKNPPGRAREADGVIARRYAVAFVVFIGIPVHVIHSQRSTLAMNR